MLAVDEHRPTLALTCERIKGGSAMCARRGRLWCAGACHSQGCWGSAVMMRSGAHLHMHPMACPWQGKGDPFEVARQIPSTWHSFNAERYMWRLVHLCNNNTCARLARLLDFP